MVERASYINFIEQHNITSLKLMQDAFRASKKRIGVVSDIDEFLVDTVSHHVQLIQRVARYTNFTGSLPTYEEILANGGTHHYAGVFGMEATDWEAIMKRIRASRFVNRNAPIYHSESANILTEGDNHELLGFMTAKPGTERTLKTTKEDLFAIDRLAFPEKPVMLRPESIEISESSAWKVGNLAHIAAADPSKLLVLADDSISTAKAIAAHNHTVGYRQIVQILYPGPLTKSQLAQGLYYPKEEEGIYVSDWETMPQVFDRINQTWQAPQN